MSNTAEVDPVIYLSEDEVASLVEETLHSASVTLEQLLAQAAEGQFESDKAKLAWFALKGLGAA